MIKCTGKVCSFSKYFARMHKNNLPLSACGFHCVGKHAAYCIFSAHGLWNHERIPDVWLGHLLVLKRHNKEIS